MSYRDVILADNPVAYWRLGETSGNVADELGLNPSTTANPPTYGVAGAIAGDSDTAISFPTGVEFLSIPDSLTFDLGDGPFSWECWVKRLLTGEDLFDASGGYHTAMLMSKGTQGAFYFAFDQITFDVDASYVAYESGLTDDAGNWHHFVFTRVATGTGNMVIYKDGVAVALSEGDIDDVATTSAEPLVFGMYYDGFNYPSFSVMDEVAIYDYVLSPEQVLAHYQAAQSVDSGIPVFIFGGL